MPFTVSAAREYRLDLLLTCPALPLMPLAPREYRHLDHSQVPTCDSHDSYCVSTGTTWYSREQYRVISSHVWYSQVLPA